jgi:hypothetical protein
MEKAKENRHVQMKNRRAVTGVSEQFGESSIRSSMRARITQGAAGEARRGRRSAAGKAPVARAAPDARQFLRRAAN